MYHLNKDAWHTVSSVLEWSQRAGNGCVQVREDSNITWQDIITEHTTSTSVSLVLSNLGDNWNQLQRERVCCSKFPHHFQKLGSVHSICSQVAQGAAGQEWSELAELQVHQQNCIIAPVWPRHGYTEQSRSTKTHHEQEKMIIVTSSNTV